MLSKINFCIDLQLPENFFIFIKHKLDFQETNTFFSELVTLSLTSIVRFESNLFESLNLKKNILFTKYIGKKKSYIAWIPPYI